MTHQLTPAQRDAIHYLTRREGIASIDDCKQAGVRTTTLRALERRGMVHVSDTVVVLLTEGSDGEPATVFRPVIDGCDCYQDAFDRWVASPYVYPYPSETDACRHVGEATADYQESVKAARRLGREYGADTVTVEVARYWAEVRMWDALTTVAVENADVEGEPAADGDWDDDVEDVEDDDVPATTEPATEVVGEPAADDVEDDTEPAPATEPADVEDVEAPATVAETAPTAPATEPAPATVVKPKGLTPAQKRVIDYLDAVGGSATYSEVLGSTRVKRATLRALEKRELITTDGSTVTRINPVPTTADLTEPQQHVYEVLRYHGPATVSELRDRGITRATVDALESQGMVAVSGDTVRLATTIGLGTWVETIINGLRMVCQVWAFAVGGLWVVDAHQRAHKVTVSEVAVVGTGSPAEQPSLFGAGETEGETEGETAPTAVEATPTAESAPAVEATPTAVEATPTAVEATPTAEFRGTPIPDLPGVMTLDATVTVPSGDLYAPPTYTYPATGTPVRVFITLGKGGDPVYEYGTVLGVTEDRTPYGLVAVRYERGVIAKVGPYSVSPADRDVTPAAVESAPTTPAPTEPADVEATPAPTEPAPNTTTPATTVTEAAPATPAPNTTESAPNTTATDPGMYRVTRRNGIVLYGGNLPTTAIRDARDRHTVTPITNLDTIVVDGGDTTTLPTTCRELWQTARDTGTTWEINAWQENGRPVVRLSLMLPARDRYIRFVWVNGRLNSQRSGMSVRAAKRHMTGTTPTPATPADVEATPTATETAPTATESTPAPTAPAPTRYLTRYGKTWDRNGVIATQARDPHGDVWAVAYNRDTRQVTVRHRDSGWTAKRVVTRIEDVNPVAEELAKARTTPTTPATTENATHPITATPTATTEPATTPQPQQPRTTAATARQRLQELGPRGEALRTGLLTLHRNRHRLNSEQTQILNIALRKVADGDAEGAISQLHRVPMTRGRAKKLLAEIRQNIAFAHRAETPAEKATRIAAEEHAQKINEEDRQVKTLLAAHAPTDPRQRMTWYENALGRKLTRAERHAATRRQQWPRLTLEQAHRGIKRQEDRQRMIDDARRRAAEERQQRRQRETTEPAAETRATTPRQWQHLGTTTDITTCECCGRTDLTRTIIIVAIDADGTPHGEPTHYGTTCAARALGTTTADVRASAAAADRRREILLGHAHTLLRTYQPVEHAPLADQLATVERHHGALNGTPRFRHANAARIVAEKLAEARAIIAADGRHDETAFRDQITAAGKAARSAAIAAMYQEVAA